MLLRMLDDVQEKGGDAGPERGPRTEHKLLEAP